MVAISTFPPTYQKREEGEAKVEACQTFTGKKFWPLNPTAEDVDIRDIAQALSLKCRFGGHCSRHYSVAQHSVLVESQVGKAIRELGLDEAIQVSCRLFALLQALCFAKTS